MTRMAHTLGLLGAALLVGLTGCGGEAGPKVYPVKGTLVYKGAGDAAKLAGYQVLFESMSEPKVTASGEVQSDGTFSVRCYLEGKDRLGVPAGDYRVSVRPPREDDSGPRPAGLLHPRFHTFAKSNLKVTVAPGANTPTIEVEAGR